MTRTALALTVLLLSGATQVGARQEARGSTQAAPAGDAETGRQTFAKKGCYACHGREGQGSPTTGPRLGPNPTAFAALTRYVRTPRGQMPPYTEKVLSDTELADIYAFLKARPPAVSIETVLPAK
jgi:ubiquinol-cytochrome c reductase cytochrome c subunit